jgi:hypothetical protein
MVRPERFELPTLWFVARRTVLGSASGSNQVEENIGHCLLGVAWCSSDLLRVHGQKTDNPIFRALPNAKVRPPPRQRRLSGDRAELLLQFGVPDDNLLDLYAEAVNVYERPLHGVATDPSGFWVAVGSFFFEPRALKAHAEGLPANWQEFCGRRGARQPGACWFGS